MSAWEYQGTLSKSDARKWSQFWVRLGWSVKLEKTRKGNYHTFLKFAR